MDILFQVSYSDIDDPKNEGLIGCKLPICCWDIDNLKVNFLFKKWIQIEKIFKKVKKNHWLLIKYVLYLFCNLKEVKLIKFGGITMLLLGDLVLSDVLID
mgnify:CR=1 FL=1